MSTLAKFAESRGKHDHHRCVTQALRAAETVCERRHLQLTPIRRRVLELVWRRHAPVRAYDILSALKKGEGALAPPTVYRALEFLLDAGLIHRVDSLNAYIGCESPHHSHAGQLLICTECQRVAELADDSIAELVARKARSAGFSANARAVEIKGICNDCQARANEE
jgi:Fur family zinc uptake transcriptional regulator